MKYCTIGDKIMVLRKSTAPLSVHESKNAESLNRHGSKFACQSSEHSLFAIKKLRYKCIKNSSSHLAQI
jgi:D-lyxose ketol-isomerase